MPAKRTNSVVPKGGTSSNNHNEGGASTKAPAQWKATVSPPAMQRFPTLRRNSFLYELQGQLQSHLEEEPMRQRQKEVKNIHRILEKPPESREAHEIDTLYEWVLKNGSTSKIFQGAQEIICKTICREMTLLELPPQGVVCYQGDYGDTFYVIITGSVSLFIDPKPKPRIALDDDNYPKSASMRRLSLTSSNKRMESEDDDRPPSEQYGSFIKHITDGGTFGELAVMDPTARRSCTITCDVPTSFICLKRGAYQRLIRITNSSQLDFTQVEFLETIYFFDGWPHGELTRLSNRMRNLNFPADTYLTRIGSEANVVFFIYAGIVQETVPMLQFLNENGGVQRCTELETDCAKRSEQGLGGNGSRDGKGKKQRELHQKRRVELELSLYQDHDICGEYPILFSKPSCNTDLLAVTDVKTLVMDRETWKELFFFHGLDHIRESYTKLRKLAEARENWRKTRVKLTLANPGLVLTISTKSMMQDGKCMCGWCGSKDHTTGDPTCLSLLASRKKLEDKKEKALHAKRPKKTLGEITAKAQTAIKDRHNLARMLSQAHSLGQSEPHCMLVTSSAAPSPANGIMVPSPPSLPAPRRIRAASIKVAAVNIISSPIVPQTMPTTVAEENNHNTAVPETASNRLVESKPGAPKAVNVAAHRKAAISDFAKLAKASKVLYTRHEQAADGTSILPAIKVEDVRKGAFTEALEEQYKQEMVKKVKRLSSMDQYYGVRAKVLGKITDEDAQTSEERVEKQGRVRRPRKPKIPKPSRRLVCSKTKQLRPDRFNRKINRMLRRLWVKDHPLPVVEESLREL